MSLENEKEAIDLSDIFFTGKRKFSDDHRKKISEAKKGKPHSSSHRENISKALKGKRFTKEHREKIRNALKGNKNALKDKEKVSNDLLAEYSENETCVNWIRLNRLYIDSFKDVKTENQLLQNNIKEEISYNDSIMVEGVEDLYLDTEDFVMKRLDKTINCISEINLMNIFKERGQVWFG